MRPKSLRANLILWFTFVFGLVLFVSDYVTYSALRAVMLAELDSGLVSMATLESAAYKEGNTLDLESISRRADQYPRFIHQFVQVLDAQGAVLGQSGLPAESNSVINQSQLSAALSGAVVKSELLLDDKPVRLAALSGERDGQPFTVVIGVATDSVRRTMSRVGMIILAIDILAIVASIAGGYLIIGNALKPVDHITERAHLIGEGNLRQRLQYIDSSSEMVRLTTVLNEMLDKLQRLFDSQKQFIQDASHETRSPIAALRCRLEVALRQTRSAAEYRQVIEGSLQDATRLTVLADDLFLLARADSNNLSMELREVSLSEAAAGVYEQFMPVAEARGIEFTLDAQSDCVVYADRPRINQALRNLIENALKYTPKGGRVSVSVTHDGEFVRVDVIDTGIGIPLEEQAKIFRRFYRVDHARARSDGGTGLGLAICDQIVRAHQGGVEVESALGHGARFTMRLAAATSLLDK
ncbi:MAG: ATP-binding protein [Blastocatellia bacterium]